MSIELSTRPERRTISNARIVTPEDVIDTGHLVIEGDRIVDVGAGRTGQSEGTVDADGRLLLPGLVDLHGDDFERHLFPRSGARTDTETALLACDRANVAAGVTTKFHAVAFEDAPEDRRSVVLAEEVVDAVSSVDELLADNRIHARCELADEHAVEAVVAATDRSIVDLVSLVNHLPGQGQFDDQAQFNRRYTDGGTEPAQRADRVAKRRERVPPRQLLNRAQRVVRAAKSVDVTVATHDDEDEGEIATARTLDVSISEYPVTMEAARHASRLGLCTAMGAPNLVRGESLWGNLSAKDAIQAGIVDVLCSDYHPPSLLESAFVDTDESLVDRIARITQAPADAVGFDDRGRIEPGARADVILVDPTAPISVERAFVGGTEVYRAANGP